MKHPLFLQILLAGFMVVASTVCSSCRGATPAPTAPTATSKTSESPAASAIRRYLQARVARDVNRAIALSCGDWEKQARIEVDALRADAKLAELTCHDSGVSGEFTLVACTGKILISYSGETRELDLSRRRFRAVAQGSDWLMCGYQ